MQKKMNTYVQMLLEQSTIFQNTIEMYLGVFGCNWISYYSALNTIEYGYIRNTLGGTLGEKR